MPAVRRLGTAMLLLVIGAGLSACGDTIDVAEDDPLHRGAVLFSERCAGCHTLDAAAARGSRPDRQTSGGERTNGPNFNQRKESYEDVIYAIQNGGFSGAIMPANIVLGGDAEEVAKFVEKYAGGGDAGSTDQGN